MTDVDAFATQLLEEAKRFLEKAAADTGLEGKEAFLHAALLLGFATLEAHLNSIAEDFLVRGDLSLLDRSLLSEREVILEDGQWTMIDRLKIYRLEDRLEFIQRRFSQTLINKNSPVWSDFMAGLHFRNRLTHPKGAETITEDQTRRTLQAIIDTIHLLYQAVYKRPFPSARRGLHATMQF